MKDDEKKIRHTINAEEAFTLAKDVFDIRTFFKNLYKNRALIARRINVITLCVSMLYTLLYASYVLYRALGNSITYGQQIFIYSCLGVYAAVLIALLIIFPLSSQATTRNLKRYSLTLRIIRLIIKLLSIAMSISAIVISVSNGGSNSNIALDITIIVLSIISMIVMSLPMFFGGIGKFVRWLLSPAKAKLRFSVVVMEWYELAITDEKPAKGARKKVAKKHYSTIDRLIDEILLPALGKKYVIAIKSPMLLSLAESCPEEDRHVLEGVLKSVFAYAEECGYVTFNPCRDLNFEGTVEEEKKTMKERFMGLGAKVGKKVLGKYIASTYEDEDD